MRKAFIVLSAVVLVVIDQFTKWLARIMLAGGPVPLIKGVFEFQLTTNSGVAFGLFEGYTLLFSVFTAIILAALLYVLLSGRFTELRVVNVCGTLIIAGGTGNLIDRIAFGEVTDFLYFKLINFAIFNAADCFVVIGSAVLLFYFLFLYKEKPAEKDALRVQSGSEPPCRASLDDTCSGGDFLQGEEPGNDGQPYTAENTGEQGGGEA